MRIISTLISIITAIVENFFLMRTQKETEEKVAQVLAQRAELAERKEKKEKRTFCFVGVALCLAVIFFGVVLFLFLK